MKRYTFFVPAELGVAIDAPDEETARAKLLTLDDALDGGIQVEHFLPEHPDAVTLEFYACQDDLRRAVPFRTEDVTDAAA